MNKIAYLESPVGYFKICVSEKELLSCEWFFSRPGKSESSPLIRETTDQLKAYFKTRSNFKFDLPLKMVGTEFQVQVWTQICKIPFGKTLSYGELAKKIHTRGFRAVGGALNKNPIALIVPCHRILSQQGLGGYAPGIKYKKLLLAHEGIEFDIA